jgi:transcription elongation regulator 1
MVGASAATKAFANPQPSSVLTGGDRKEQASTNPGSEQPTLASSEPGSTGNAFAGVDIWSWFSC